MARISIDRVLDKLDEYLGLNDYLGAERHLKYWLSEAEIEKDERSEFTILNEMIGLFRKCGEEEKAFWASDKLLLVVDKMDIKNEVSGATAFLNIATAYKCFGKIDEALLLYEKAKIIYEKELDEKDSRLGGLYNNMALALVDVEKYIDAENLYNKALIIMGYSKNGELEQAITYLNIAELMEKRDGLQEADEKIDECLKKAEKLLKTETIPRNGYYAFVAEKCASSFDYYGYFAFANELNDIANKIRGGEKV